MTFGDLQTAALRRAGSQYTAADAGLAINEAQRLFVLLTLCLEASRELPLTPGAWRYRMLREWSDWIAPLRVRLTLDQDAGNDAEFGNVEGGAARWGEERYAGRPLAADPKLRPATLSELRALDNSWIHSPGTPTRYAAAGFDNLLVYGQPAAPGTALLITYARSPQPLVKPADVPEIPETDHPALWQFAVPRLRLAEGGQELQKAMTLLGSFLDTSKRRAAQVRARSLGRYDKLPLELERFDLSRVIRLRPDLPPWRKETQWPPASTSRS